ncbi:MAG: polymer-forming cytoskeletal protein [Sulfuricaulis sp.]|uniref:polymer-forming cytoskeletal protein n=1 Tax=Sulfuricaulis sp. TaxID=2003553 RepID=UPI0034A4D168
MKLDEILKIGNKNRRTLDRVEDFATMLGPQSRYQGVFQGHDNHIVYGEVQGECDIEGVLVLGEGSRWTGNIRAVSVVVAGTVDGDIHATSKVELARTAIVRGKITSPVVAIARGASHDGSIRMAKQTQITRYHERREANESEPLKEK